MSARKHSLVEHWNDVSTWWHDVKNTDMTPYPHANDQQQQMVFFTAYERWLNDRELLTVEDGYVWNYTPTEPWESPRSGTIG